MEQPNAEAISLTSFLAHAAKAASEGEHTVLNADDEKLLREAVKAIREGQEAVLIRRNNKRVTWLFINISLGAACEIMGEIIAAVAGRLRG